MPRRIPAHREAWRSTMSDDGADNDGIPQPGEFDATPVVTNEDDVSTESDLVGDQVPENVTTRRSSGMAGPTSDSSRSVISSLPQSRGPTEEPDPLELRFSKLIKDIETFFGPDPLGEPFSKEFSRTCAEPIPRAPPCDELFTFMALEASEVTDNDFRTVEYVLKNRKAEYEEICSALKMAAEKEKIKSRRSSVGAIDKPIQMDFKEQKDCPLTEPENKTPNEMTSGTDLSDSQFGAIVSFLQSTSQSKFHAGVKPPSNLYVRYCVLADVFRLFKNNQLSAYGEAYRRVHDPSWEATTQEYASKYPAYNFNGADNKVAVGTNQDGAGGGGGGRGGGRKGFRKN